MSLIYWSKSEVGIGVPTGVAGFFRGTHEEMGSPFQDDKSTAVVPVDGSEIPFTATVWMVPKPL